LAKPRNKAEDAIIRRRNLVPVELSNGVSVNPNLTIPNVRSYKLGVEFRRAIAGSGLVSLSQSLLKCITIDLCLLGFHIVDDWVHPWRGLSRGIFIRDVQAILHLRQEVGVFVQQVPRATLGMNANVHAQRGFYGNALQAASHGGHEAVVRLLLEQNADVNAPGGRYGNAFLAASARGHDGVKGLLRDEGRRQRAGRRAQQRAAGGTKL